MAAREQTQQVSPVQQAIMIHDMMGDIPSGKGRSIPTYATMAQYFKKQSWAPREWHAERFICECQKVYTMFVEHDRILNL